VIYLIAIVSWWTQVTYLVGEEGLIPASKFLDLVKERLSSPGQSPFLALPNLFWVTGASDFAFHSVCWIGVMLSCLVIVGRYAGPALILLWLIYLSLLNTGGVFMSFQWDILLLEAGFLACFLTDWKKRAHWRNPPPLSVINRIALVWAWLFIAKLMFFSGWVKLAWATPAQPEWWPAHTAMTFHYMTQPIPTWTAWWAHHLPEWFHKASIWPMYFIELVLPFAILFGRFGRLTASIGFSLLMLLILATGNYTYFNWLSIVLCLPLIHDRLWPEWLRRKLNFTPTGITTPPARRPLVIKLACVAPAFLVAILLNFHVVSSDLAQAPKPFLKIDPTPEWLDSFRKSMDPFRLVSGYGLFRTMTTDRPEIILEGSPDGITWSAYDFAWKVDELADRPRFVAPHQPRVAWQFWFAALERQFNYNSRNAAWIEMLVIKILKDEPQVDKLIKYNPFPDSPPKFVRARLFIYEFTTPQERAASGDWWKRTAAGDYLPSVSLNSNQP
tara:strand:- start:813 stop:2312 length:1500 start_codon:yes stop_codon:yes gene_type:complete